jgi:LAGLIDADG DNA endonuclease family
MLTLEQSKIKKKWEKANLKISRELRDIIHGYVMSDGYLTISGSLQVDQSKQQENFVKWLYNKLEPIRTDSPIMTVIREDSRSVGVALKKTYSLRFYTKTLLKGFRNMWYQPYVDEKGITKYRKRLPKSISCILNSLVLTLWFAGDGTKIIGQKGAKIEVTAFTPEERRTLQKLMKQKFNISVNVVRSGLSKSGTQQWAISINASEYQKFRDLITQIDLIPRFFPDKLHRQS